MATITTTEDGASGRYIDLGSSASQDDIGAQTIIVYCKPATQAGNIGYYFSKGDATGGGIRVIQNTANQVAVGSNSSTALAPSKVTTSGLTLGTWQHWQCTCDGSISGSGFDIYIDAASSNGTPADGTGSITSDASHNVFLLNRTGLGRSVEGDVAYVARWNRVLSGAEMTTVRADGPLAVPSGLILCWCNDQDYSTNSITASARSAQVAGSTPTNTALGPTGTTISTTVGNAVAAGITASVVNASDKTITATVGNAVANGITASISVGVTISATVGNASASGISAVVNTATVVAAVVGNAVASGVTATIQSMALSGAYERSSYNPTGSSISGTGDSAIISIVPKVQESEVTDTRWLEPSVNVSGVNGFRPTFRFLNYKDGTNGVHSYSASAWTTSRRPVYSYDSGATWNYFDTAPTLDTTNQWVEFRHSAAFTGNNVRIGRGRQLTVHQIGDWVASLASTYSGFFVPSTAAAAYTPTGSVSGFSAQTFIADEFSTQTDSLGATVPITPLYAAEINDTSLAPVGGHAKRVALICSGNHAGEDHGTVLFQRFVEYLCGASTQAQNLRRDYRILVYPCLNAPGRAGGGWRGSWTQGVAGVDDMNRHFNETGTTLEIIDKPKAAMTTDIASAVPDWVIDFHATYASKWSVFKDAADAYHTSFFNKLTTLSGVTITDEGDTGTGFLASYFKTLSTKLSVTKEVGDPSPVSDAEISSYATAMVQTLDSMSADGLFFINAIPGNAVAAGITATITVASGVVISAVAGNAVADGSMASIVRKITAIPGDAVANGSIAALLRTIATTPGNAVAGGVLAGVTTAGVTTINATPGNASADGATASVIRTIAASPGDAVANGSIAALLQIIAATPGGAVANGVTASISSGSGTAIFPLPAQVLLGVTYGPTGSDYTGTATGSGLTANDIAAAVWAYTP